MSNFYKLSIFALSIFVIFSFVKCKSNTDKSNTKKGDLIIIKPNTEYKAPETASAIPLSSFVDSISYVTLKMPENVAIGRISRIEAFDDLIVVSDLKLSKSVLLFNNAGNFIAKITESSVDDKLPKRIQDVSIDRKKQEINIYSDAQASVFIYDKKGVFKRIVGIPNGYFSTLIKRGDDFLGYRELTKTYDDDDVQNYRLCLIDSAGKFLKGWYKGARNVHFQIPFPRPFKKYANTENVVLENPNLDTLDQLDDKSNEITPIIAFDFGKNNRQIEKGLFNIKNVKEYLDVLARSAKIAEVPIYTKNTIWGEYSCNGYVYNFIHIVGTDKTVCGNGFQNDINGIQVSADSGYWQIYKGEVYTLVDLVYLQKEKEMFRRNKQTDPYLSDTKKNLLSLSQSDPNTFVLAKLKIKNEK